MEQCRYCSMPIDRQAAAVAAETQSKVNQACSDASFARTAAVAIFIFLGLTFVPFISFFSSWAFVVTFLAVAVMLIRWQIKFGRLHSGDPDYQRAKRVKNVTLLLWILAIPAFVVRELLGVILSAILSQ
jgi:hypothetical protein